MDQIFKGGGRSEPDPAALLKYEFASAPTKVDQDDDGNDGDDGGDGDDGNDGGDGGEGDIMIILTLFLSTSLLLRPPRLLKMILMRQMIVMMNMAMHFLSVSLH